MVDCGGLKLQTDRLYQTQLESPQQWSSFYTVRTRHYFYNVLFKLFLCFSRQSYTVMLEVGYVGLLLTQYLHSSCQLPSLLLFESWQRGTRKGITYLLSPQQCLNQPFATWVMQHGYTAQYRLFKCLGGLAVVCVKNINVFFKLHPRLLCDLWITVIECDEVTKMYFPNHGQQCE